MNIVVLAGGISTERDVSLISGQKIYQAIKGNGHHAVLLDVFLGYEGDISHIFEEDINWEAQVTGIKETNPDIEKVKAMRPDWQKNFFGPNVIAICQKADVVFMALHGENGENGKIQACFDLMGITYTGTDYVSSALSMDKGLTKDIFRQYGVPTPQGFRLKKGEKEPEEVTFPCIVKACCGGSSVGVYIAHTNEEYWQAMKDAFSYEPEVVVEEYIEGREFSVGVVDGKAYPIIEIAPIEGFYDYTNKYKAGATVDTCPAVLTEEQTKEMQKHAEDGAAALGIENYCRLDFMMRKDGRMYCLEANTLPGMTPTSLLPQEAQVLGISYPELCELLIQLSLRKRGNNA